jgi:hypothetical protein
LGTSKKETQWRINVVDKEGKQFMTHAEHVSQNLKSGRIYFFPQSVIWIKRKQIYCLLMEYELSCNKNQGNLK